MCPNDPPSAPASRRLDQALVATGLCTSREQAKRLILAGRVRVNDRPAHKPGQLTRPDDRLSIEQPERYVSRGGYKLEHGLRHFGLDVTGLTVVDLGASTGGFTDCLLQHGAARVYAVDVGRGLLAWRLRQDARVVVVEGVNARYLTPATLSPSFEPVPLVVVDCSFISLRKILPAAIALLRPGGRILALVKPQFEAGRVEAARGAGVIRDPAIHERVLREVREFAVSELPLQWLGATESPLRGPAGNKEFLVLLEKPS